ncbi:MAG: MBL fold metallo-hydrolase [Chloroflexi bacterium]|nr:MBL fold metallo-hydrolase [Chloroflexota bacterium]
MVLGDGVAVGGAGGPVRLRFWGVRGSIPTPGLETVRYGGNTSCVTVETDGAELYILDAGSGIRQLGLELLRQKRLPIRAHLLLTHTHWDHIQGFPFFAPAFIPGNQVTVYGGTGTDDGLAEALAGQMLYRYFPVSIDKLGATLRFQHVGPGSHQIGAMRVTVAELHHTGPTVGYRLEIGGRVLAYVTDSEPPGGPQDLTPEKAAVHLAHEADVLIHDAQYADDEYPAKVGWGHSPLSYVVDVAHAARAKHLLLFHHDPTRTDERLDALVAAARERAAQLYSPVRIDAAMEGQEITLEHTGTSSPVPVLSASG